MRTPIRVLAPFACCLASAACDAQLRAPSSPDAAVEAGAADASHTPDASDAANSTPLVPQGAAPTAGGAGSTPTSAELATFARANNAFALDLYAKARAQPGNLAFSPFSIASALAMTAAGARTETAAQMRKVLHLGAGGSDRDLDVAGSLIASYGAPEQKITIRVANRLFGDKAFTFEKPYLARVQAAFGAPLEVVDFQHASDAARLLINGWVATQTQNHIQSLIPPNGVDDTTRLVLANAIYFLGDWATPFDKRRTSNAAFFATKADQHPVPTMHATESFGYATRMGAKILDLPYENGAIALTIVLPNDADGLGALEARLTADELAGLTRSLASTRVAVSLPKFEIDPKAALSLGDLLKSLGMPLAFDREKADFSGMAIPPSPSERLYLGKVFHKAFVRVDEKGTEAAAATAVSMMRATAVMRHADPVEFKADHPFLFLLRDTSTGLVLFMGRVGDPASKS
jgi:serpin B